MSVVPSDDSDARGRSGGSSSGALKAGELGFAEVLFQALTSAAPGLSVTLAVIVDRRRELQ